MRKKNMAQGLSLTVDWYKTILSFMITASVSFSSSAFATAPTPLACISTSTTPGWAYDIQLKNNCSQSVDLTGAVLSFQSNVALNSTSLWGFSHLAYPSPSPQLEQTNSNPLTYAYTYQFGSWASAANKSLAPGQVTNLTFSAPTDPANMSLSNIMLYAGAIPVTGKGSISFASAAPLPTQAHIMVKGDNNYQYTIDSSNFHNNSYVLDQVPYGLYHLSGNVTVNGQTQNLDITPNTLTLSNSTPNSNVQITMPTPTAQVKFTFQLPNKPNDQALTNALVITADSGNQSTTTQPVAWGSNTSISLAQSSSNYNFSVPDIVGRYGIYHFEFSPSNANADQSRQINVTYSSIPNQTYPVTVNVNGLPHLPSGQYALVNYTNSTGTVYSDSIVNGSNTSSLPSGTYTVAAGAITVNGTAYVAKPQQISVSSGNNSINISYTAQAAAQFIPYMDATVNADWSHGNGQPANIDAYINQTGVKAFHMAFITDAGKCQPAWAGVSSLPAIGGTTAWGYDWFKSLEDKGGEAIIAFGGASGTDLSVNCNTAELVDQYQAVINTYHPEGLDFDIEGALVNNAVAYTKIIQALKTIQGEYPALPISFTLPTMPDGLDNNGRAVVKVAFDAGLNFKVNIMAMDYGPSYSGDMGQYAISASEGLFQYLQSLYGSSKTSAQLYKMIGITPMIGVNDVATEYFTLADATQVRAYALEHQIGFLSEWSFARDNPCNDVWASPTCSGGKNGLPLQSQAYDFTKAFVGQ